jgi:hypothetical protein
MQGNGFPQRRVAVVRLTWRKLAAALVLLGVIAAMAALYHRQEPAPSTGPLPPLAAPRILIEKSAQRLTLFDGDRQVRSYRVCCGSAPGDKEREGDRRTPEGDFYVCLRNPDSKFTLSLGLSYPNAEDAARGLRRKLITQAQHDAIVAAIAERRQPDWYTPLGGEIMIHGAGADRGGTLGCIGLDDPDIRELYDAVPLGTPVTIVP